MNKDEIKKLRQSLGLSQQTFATQLGIGIATVSRWELGLFKPSKLALEKLNNLKDKENE
jgi:DNA-binding transcriptional regulator YiaG